MTYLDKANLYPTNKMSKLIINIIYLISIDKYIYFCSMNEISVYVCSKNTTAQTN